VRADSIRGKQIVVLVRLVGVNLVGGALPWWGELVAVVLPGGISWPVAVAVASMFLGVLGYRLCAELLRRKTVVAILTNAPSGTVIEQQTWPGGPALRIRVGDQSIEWSRPDAGYW
jgi:hypothetical protein